MALDCLLAIAHVAVLGDAYVELLYSARGVAQYGGAVQKIMRRFCLCKRLG